MNNIFDYLKWRGDLSFDIIPFNEVDSLILSSFIYARYSGIISSNYAYTPITINEAITKLLTIRKPIVRTKTDIEFLKLLKDTKRYKDLKCFYHKEVYDHINETQFGAVTINLLNGSLAVVYRGTDNFVAGWKEDLNLSYQIVPAQSLALDYLNDVLNRYPDHDVLVMGHSKGGHLAMYASAFTSDNNLSKIKAIYNLDGPGFDFKIFDINKLTRIKDKLYNYTPKWSFVGSFMQQIKEFDVVESDEFTVIQHDPYAWGVEANSFIKVKEIDKSAEFIKELFNKWLDDLNLEERQKFVNAAYDVIYASKAEDIRDIIPNIIRYRKDVQSVIKNLDEKTSQAISSALNDLRKVTGNTISSRVSENLNQIFKRKN